jgi:hypothetical protein
MSAKMADAAIDVLLAKQAMTEVLYRYCRAFDRMDLEMARTIWHPDGTCNYSNRAGAPDMKVADYFGPSWAHRAKLRNHSHQITNILIEVAGEKAVSEACFTASLQTEPENGKIIEHLYRGRYLDRWSRRDGVWAIDHRQVLFDSYTPYEFAVDRLKDVPMELSRRDRDDPSYAHFKSLR